MYSLRHGPCITHVAFSPDGGRILTTSFDRTARIWNAADGKLLVELTGHEAPLYMGRFDPAGERVVTASEDGTARVYVAATGELWMMLSGHGGPVHWAEFGPDGDRIITASEDGTCRIWPADPLSAARRFAPRELTAEEIDRYTIDAAPTGG